jgi:hypothetical protein
MGGAAAGEGQFASGRAEPHRTSGRRSREKSSKGLSVSFGAATAGWVFALLFPTDS